MPTTCEIDFDNNPQKVFYAGQLLCGSVRLTLTKENGIRGVYIRIYGTAYCHWTSGSGDNRKSYTGKEDYLNEKTYFVGDSNGNSILCVDNPSEMRLMPGTYNYTFQCMLPPNLPTSVEGEIGYIRYTARVVVDIPMWPDDEFEVPFTVIKAINLNAIPGLREPAIAEKDKTFCVSFLCCYASDPLKIVVRTPVGGYTPGQVINLEVNVNNQSDQPVSDFTVQLIKQITYFTHANSSRQRLESHVLMEQDTRGCDANQTEIIRVNLELQPLPPTDFSTSNIVKVRYSIRVIGSVACCHSNPVLELPITIGSYPLQDNSMYPYQHTVTNNVIEQPTAPQLPQLLDQNNYSTTPYPNMLTAPIAPLPFSDEDLPTYAEAVHLKDPTGNNFKPKYGMFKRTTSYSSGN